MTDSIDEIRARVAADNIEACVLREADIPWLLAEVDRLAKELSAAAIRKGD